MKRIKEACLEQTIHFQLNENLCHEAALSAVKAEVEAYKTSLKKKEIRHRIVNEETQKDGSVILKLKRPYNAYAVGDYMN